MTAQWLGPLFVEGSDGSTLVYLAAIAIPILGLLVLTTESIRGLRRNGIADAVRFVGPPASTATAVILLRPDSAALAFTYYVVSTLAFLCIALTVWLALQSRLNHATDAAASLPANELLRSSIPLLGATLATQVVVWAPTFALSALHGAEQAGLLAGRGPNRSSDDAASSRREQHSPRQLSQRPTPPGIGDALGS